MGTAPSRVFVVHEPLKAEYNERTAQTEWVRTRDVTIAREHGELIYMFPAGRLSADPDYLVETAREKLKDFSVNDYLLLSGDTAAMCISSIVAAQRLGTDADHLQLLLWDGRLKRYFPMRPRLQKKALEQTAARR